MDTPFEDKHAPDPKCCGCGLKPRCLGNDLLRLILIALLLLPIILLLSACETRRDGFGMPSVTFAPEGTPDASRADFAMRNPYGWLQTRVMAVR